MIKEFFSASLRKEVSHKGTKAQTWPAFRQAQKMQSIFLSAFVPLWLNPFF
jgi:hypothetical protein